MSCLCRPGMQILTVSNQQTANSCLLFTAVQKHEIATRKYPSAPVLKGCKTIESKLDYYTYCQHLMVAGLGYYVPQFPLSQYPSAPVAALITTDWAVSGPVQSQVFFNLLKSSLRLSKRRKKSINTQILIENKH